MFCDSYESNAAYRRLIALNCTVAWNGLMSIETLGCLPTGVKQISIFRPNTHALSSHELWFQGSLPIAERWNKCQAIAEFALCRIPQSKVG